jgi:hypothetical protein
MYFYSCRCWIHVWWIGLGIEFIFDLYLMCLTYLTCTFVRGDIYGLSFAKTLTSTWDALQKSLQYKTQHTDTKKRSWGKLHYIMWKRWGQRWGNRRVHHSPSETRAFEYHFQKNRKTHHYSSDLSKATRSNIVIFMLLNHIPFRFI